MATIHFGWVQPEVLAPSALIRARFTSWETRAGYHFCWKFAVLVAYMLLASTIAFRGTGAQLQQSSTASKLQPQLMHECNEKQPAAHTEQQQTNRQETHQDQQPSPPPLRLLLTLPSTAAEITNFEKPSPQGNKQTLEEKNKLQARQVTCSQQQQQQAAKGPPVLHHHEHHSQSQHKIANQHLSQKLHQQHQQPHQQQTPYTHPSPQPQQHQQHVPEPASVPVAAAPQQYLPAAGQSQPPPPPPPSYQMAPEVHKVQPPVQYSVLGGEQQLTTAGTLPNQQAATYQPGSSLQPSIAPQPEDIKPASFEEEETGIHHKEDQHLYAYDDSPGNEQNNVGNQPGAVDTESSKEDQQSPSERHMSPKKNTKPGARKHRRKKPKNQKGVHSVARPKPAGRYRGRSKSSKIQQQQEEDLPVGLQHQHVDKDSSFISVKMGSLRKYYKLLSTTRNPDEESQAGHPAAVERPTKDPTKTRLKMTIGRNKALHPKLKAGKDSSLSIAGTVHIPSSTSEETSKKDKQGRIRYQIGKLSGVSTMTEDGKHFYKAEAVENAKPVFNNVDVLRKKMKGGHLMLSWVPSLDYPKVKSLISNMLDEGSSAGKHESTFTPPKTLPFILGQSTDADISPVNQQFRMDKRVFWPVLDGPPDRPKSWASGEVEASFVRYCPKKEAILPASSSISTSTDELTEVLVTNATSSLGVAGNNQTTEPMTSAGNDTTTDNSIEKLLMAAVGPSLMDADFAMPNGSYMASSNDSSSSIETRTLIPYLPPNVLEDSLANAAGTFGLQQIENATEQCPNITPAQQPAGIQAAVK